MPVKTFNTKVISFSLKGHYKYPVYEIILTTKKKGNSFTEKLGFFNPNVEERLFFINVPRLAFWLNSGVVMNFSVKKHLVKFIV